MKIVINIPKAFENHFNYDRFEDSLERIKFSIFDGTSLCGNYEIETMDMLIKALKKSTKLPKEHGDLADKQSIVNQIANTNFWLSADNWSELMEAINDTPTIIKANKESN